MEPVGKLERAASPIQHGGPRGKPVGTLHVVDPSPLNWLWITYNTVEELVRVRPGGNFEPTTMTAYRWADDRKLGIGVRADERFPDGERLSAETIKRAFDEQQR